MSRMCFDDCNWCHGSGIGPQTVGVIRQHLEGQMVPAHEYLCMKCHKMVGQTQDSLVPDQVLWQCCSLNGK